MRRPLRPFTVETKKGARRADKPSQPVQAPSPFLEPEPVTERRRSSPQMKAAQALFEKPEPARALPGVPEAGARILRSLIEPPPPPLIFDDIADEPKRRGRKPGSKNKPRDVSLSPKTLARPESFASPKHRSKFAAFMVDGEAEQPEAPRAQPAPQLATLQQPADLTSLRRNGRLSRDQLPRGERWKARLPRYARGAGPVKRVQR